MNLKTRKVWKLKYMILTVLVFAVGICAYFGYQVYAADAITLEISGTNITNTTVDMKQKEIQIDMKSTGTVYDDANLYEISWTINTGGAFASVRQGTSQNIGIITALSPGVAELTVTVRDKLSAQGTVLAMARCSINVIFAIDTTGDDSIYKYINSSATEKSLVLYSNDAPVQLQLNFGNADSAQWIVMNSEIVSVGQWTGIVTPTGAGKTTIMATYTPEGSTTQSTASLSVYVIPRVTDSESDYNSKTFKKSMTTGLDRGAYIYLDTFFDEGNTEPLGDKVVWVIKQDDGANRKVIANSLPSASGGITSDLISLQPVSSKSSQLSVNAKAGKYYIEFYTAGTYKSEADWNGNPNKPYNPSVITLTVYASFDNYYEALSVGDSYSIANAFNLTISDYKKYFYSPILTYGGGSADNYATYSDTDTTINTKGVAQILARISPQASYINTIKELTNPSSSVAGQTTFNITLNIMDTFKLNVSSSNIYVNQTYQLIASGGSGLLDGTIKWSSSNTAYVTVTDQGLMKGVKVSTGIPDIVITASLVSDTGSIIKNASCTVSVQPTLSTFTVTPTTATMKVGESTTILTNIGSTITTAPLRWSSLDTSVATVEANPGNKSALIVAKKAGDTTITVYNTLTSSDPLSIKVKVVAPIDTITFDVASITEKKADGVDKVITLNISYTPTTANITDLTFNTANSSIATITSANTPGNGKAQATVTLKNLGKVDVSVVPKQYYNGTPAYCSITVLEAATSITLSATDVTLNAAYGTHPAETKQLSYQLTPSGADSKVTYSSTDSTCATVDANGLITAKKAGNTQIVARTEEGWLGYCNVTVKQPCESITFSPITYTMSTGSTYTPKYTLKPTNTTDTFTWKSSNTAIATVDANGVISAKKSGTTMIMVTSSSNVTSYITINVLDSVKSIALNYSSYALQKGNSFALIPTFTPATAYDTSVTWTSSDSSVVLMEEKKQDGIGAPYLKVTGLKGGITLITATTKDGGYIATCVVNVIEKATKVTVSPTSNYLKLGSTFTIKATVTNSTATNKKVTWSSSKKSVATVTSAGKVAGKKVGTAYITAKAADGSGASAQCKVMVVRKVTSVKLNKYTAKLLVGKSLVLKKTISPKNATVKTVTWSSSDNSIATVDSAGRILGLSAGMAKIRVKVNDGSGKYAICLVNVVEPVAATGVSVPQSEMTLAKGRNVQSGIMVSPANSTDSIKYFSDNKRVATVDKRGKIRTKRTGQATIYGQTSNGKYGYMDILVVGMDRTTLKMRQFDKETLSVDEISTGITWYSSNPMVASVTSGTVLGRKPGRATIYATVKGVKLSCKVKIIKIK